MKKNIKTRAAVIIGAALIIPTIVNRLIFAVAKKRGDGREKAGQYFESSLGRVHYTVQGAGKPLLLIHGAYPGSSSAEWERNIEGLSSQYKVYTVDLPCYGLSERKKTVYTAYNYALFINEFIKSVIGRPAAVIGSGEACACILLADSLSHGSVSRAVLVSPAGITEDELPTNDDSRILRLLETPIIGSCIFTMAVSRSSIAEYLEEAFYDARKITDELENSYYYNAHIGGVSSRVAYGAYASKYLNVDIKLTAVSAKIPTLVAWGEEDTKTAEAVPMLEELRPDFAYSSFKQAGRFPHYESYEKFNDEIKEFLK